MVKALLLIAFFGQDSIPYKPAEEFSVEFNMTFKKRGEADNVNMVRLSETAAQKERRTDQSPLPYLTATLTVLKTTPEEVKIKIVHEPGKVLIKRKITVGAKLQLFADFTDDIKDGVSVYNNYSIYFLSKEGEPVSKIVVEFDEEGYFLVNGQKRGKL